MKCFLLLATFLNHLKPKQMNKTEQAAKQYAKNLGCEEGVWLWKLMADFANSQPLNLDVKVDDDWVELKEPDKLDQSNIYLEAIHIRTNKKQWEAYQQANTVREKIAELEEENKNLTKLIWMPHNELQQENEKLRELLIVAGRIARDKENELNAVTKRLEQYEK